MVWAVECRRHSYGGADTPTGVGSGGPSPEKFWHFLLRNGAFWCILEHVLGQLLYDVHDISRGLIMIMKITVCAMKTISTLKPAKMAYNINCWSFRIKVDPEIFV